MGQIKVLYVIGGIMSRGGIESYTMNYYRNIDKEKVHIDFIVHGFEKGVYDDEIIKNGSKIYHIPIKSKKYFKNSMELKKIFKTGNYKIVHSHMDAMNMYVLKRAKKCNIPIRISHSHNTQHLTNNKIKYYINEYARKKINKYATDLWACSKIAGEWLYGKDSDIKIIKNAIDLEKFKFSQNLRQNYREEYNIGQSYLIGTIGRLHFQKNQIFILKVFKKIYEIDKNIKLMIIGDGPEKDKLQKYILENNLEKAVILTETKDNINEIINMFDIFVLPSRFEGLPIVAIEAQANGLKCLLSNNISKEVKILDNLEFLPIDSEEEWKEKLLSCKENSFRIDSNLIMKENGYDIKMEAKKIEKKYKLFIERI